MPLTDKYILDGHAAVPEPDLMKWAKWYETFPNRVVVKTQVAEAEVSTVFLGIDHNFSNIGTPLLFESMIFGGPCDGECHRYSTWEQSEKHHEFLVARLRRAAQ